MVVPPPPPAAGYAPDLELTAQDARAEAEVHEGAADALLTLVAPALDATTWRSNPDGADYDEAVIDERDGALLRAQMAQAEATLAVSSRLGQIAAVAERIADALERSATAAEDSADVAGDTYDSRAPRG